jgi:hypothetical protein
MRNRWLALISTLPFATSSGVAQAPPGYYVGERAFLPTSSREILSDGRFRITIERQVTDSFQRRLLDLAERLFPDTAGINVAAAKELRPPVKERLAAAALFEGERWWWDRVDGVLTPYALTGAAVRYYRDRIYERASGDNPFTFMQPVPVHRGELEYIATVEAVEPGQAGGASFVVRLRLGWNYWCGMLCAVGFSAAREVFFDAEGAVLRVESDGKPMVVMS